MDLSPHLDNFIPRLKSLLSCWRPWLDSCDEDADVVPASEPDAHTALLLEADEPRVRSAIEQTECQPQIYSCSATYRLPLFLVLRLDSSPVLRGLRLYSAEINIL